MNAKNKKTRSRKKKYQYFDAEQVQKSLNDMLVNGTSCRKAAAKFGVSKSTLNRYFNNKNSGKVGRPYVFDEENERTLAEGIALAGEWGFPLTTFDIRLIVKAHLDRKGAVEKRFKNNMPGIIWASSFIKRHSLTERLCHNGHRSRANVTSGIVHLYFDELESTLENVNPHLIISYDETNLTDDPQRKQVVARREYRYPERIMDSSKQSTSVMFSAASDGTLLPSYVVFQAQSLHSSWCDNGPDGTFYNTSKSGWFTMDVFEDWFKNIVLPYVEDFKDERKVLIGDNLSSHVSPWVIDECVKHKIRFVLVPPNSTGICHPLVEAFFKPLKVQWRAILDEWNSENAGRIPKVEFPSLLNKCLVSLGTESTIENVKSGFKGAGISPLDRNQVLKWLMPTGKKTSEYQAGASSSSFETYLEEMRRSEGMPIRKPKKKKLKVTPVISVTPDEFEDLVIKEEEETEAGPAIIYVKSDPNFPDDDD